MKALIIIAAVALLAVLVWMVTDSNEPAVQPVGAVIAARDGRSKDAEVPEAPDIRAPDAGTSAPLVDPDRLTPVRAPDGAMLDEDPFVRGWVRPASESMSLDYDDIEVALFDSSGQELAYVRTESDGFFEIVHDEPLLAGWGVGVAESTGLDGSTYPPAWVGGFRVHAPGDETVEVLIELRLGVLLQGRVLDATTGAPVSGAEISIGSDLPGWTTDESWAESNEEGLYQVTLEELPLDDALVWCRAWDYQTTVVGPVDLGTSDVYTLDFHLTPPVVLKGRVLDATTGLPVDNATVTLGSRFLAFEDDHDWDFSEDDGSFELEAEDMPLEQAWLHVETMGDHAPASLKVALPATEALEIRLQPVLAVRGVITDEDGEPVDGAEVQLVFHQGWLGIQNGIYNDDITDADGTFEMEPDVAPPMASEIVVTSLDHRPFRARFADLARFDQAENVYAIEIELER